MKMTNDNKQKQLSLIGETLFQSNYRIGENDVYLSLIELKTNTTSCGYAVLAENISEQVLCMIGCSLHNSKVIFNKLADGQVSPCNLRDVVEDLMY